MPGDEEQSLPALLAKADHDFVLLTKVGRDPDVADEIIGFHAQQAVEKALKAVLESRGIDYPHTHDVTRLLELVAGAGSAPPDEDAAIALTPWAAQLRYGDLGGGSIDRSAAIATAEAYVAWARTELAE